MENKPFEILNRYILPTLIDKSIYQRLKKQLLVGYIKQRSEAETYASLENFLLNHPMITSSETCIPDVVY